MSAILVDKRDQEFVLNEMLEIDYLCNFPKFAEHSGFDMILNEAHRFAKAEFYPTNEEADKTGCIYDPKNCTVKFPECFQKPYKKFREGGWLSMCDSPEVGGEGFPLTIGTAVSEVFYAGCFYIYGAAELSHAAAKAIENYGNEEQKELYMTRLFSGEWLGTMCLTEPEAGSDVGSIQTSATPNKDGTYSISGTKIFITGGEQDLTENIIHMVLARVEGDPPGTKGLSLFIVPKYLVDQNGQTIARNGVYCTGIESKMGLHGLATCTMAYGDRSHCTGYLLGERCKGIAEMFSMMNEQRLLVGLEGLAFSSNAFLHAVDYTQKRKQGVSVDPEKDKSGSVPIIDHPDVKRMLMTMKAYVEGGRALAYFTSYCIDLAEVTEGEEKAEWQGLVELLIPIVKAYNTDRAWEITGTAIQCAGGYGYCADYPFERLARDCKVTSIFEGTNGIQAMDLVFRKILGNRQVNFKNLMKRINQTIEQASQMDGLKNYAEILNRSKEDLEKVVADLSKKAESPEKIDIYAKATPFLEAMGDVILGWFHLWQLIITHPKLAAFVGQEAQEKAPKVLRKKKEGAFYYGKVSSAKFFMDHILKKSRGKFEALESETESVVQIFDKAFAG